MKETWVFPWYLLHGKIHFGPLKCQDTKASPCGHTAPHGEEANAGLQTVKGCDTVDGRNPAPVDMINIPLFIGFHTSQVVQDFSHQQ